jgi:hypothetical protein
LEWVPIVWIVVGFGGINIGGSYWPHYWIQIIPALSIAAAVPLGELVRQAVRARRHVRRQAGRVSLVAASVGAAAALTLIPAQPALSYELRLLRMSAKVRDAHLPYRHMYQVDLGVARWLDAHSKATASVYPLVSRPTSIFLADRPAPTSMLWYLAVSHDGQSEPDPRLVSLLSGEDRPCFIILYRNLDHFDPSGELKQVVAAHYHQVWETTDYTHVLRAPCEGD